MAKLKMENLTILHLGGKQATSPIEAERIIQGLIMQRREIIDDENDELAVLDLEYRLGQIQIDLGQYQNAEITARSAYDIRKELHIAGTSEVDLQPSQRQLCEALRGQKTIEKLQEAKTMYREVWYKKVEPSLSQKRLLLDDANHWRLENGHNLGIVLGEEDKFRAAEDQHRDVMLKRREILGDAHADTAQSAIEVICSLLRQPDVADLPFKILEVVGPVWQSSKKVRETSTFVLWCGHKLAQTFYEIGKFAQASEVLCSVWEARKMVGASNPSDTMSTAKLLALSLDAIRTRAEADAVGDWIWSTNQAHPEAGFAATPEEFQLRLCSLFRLERFAEGASNSKEEWKSCSQRHYNGTLHETTLNACDFYGAAVSQVQPTTTQDASLAIAAVQDVWKMLPVETSTLKIYYLYAYMLHSMSNDVSRASDVLSEVWRMRDTPRLAQVPKCTTISPAFAGVLERCYLWAYICVDKGKRNKARELLQYGRSHARKGSEIRKRFSNTQRLTKTFPTREVFAFLSMVLVTVRGSLTY
ncbi:hypothetical protein MMC15_004394 [Xylographa vitiligo]|nr:hypothetical protein [Xylographa vitiligo]